MKKQKKVYKRHIVAKKEKQKPKSPRIPRIITEFSRFRSIIVVDLRTIVGFISGIILLFIISEAINLTKNAFTLTRASQNRMQVEDEVVFWQGVVGKYPEYRDAYYRLALLEYSLGRKEDAKTHVQKGVSIDPHFREGKTFLEKLED